MGVSGVWPGTERRTGCTPAVTTAPSLYGILEAGGVQSTSYMDTGARWVTFDILTIDHNIDSNRIIDHNDS